MKGIIIGAGRAGQNLHYGAFKVAGAEILAFVDPNLDAAKKAAERFNLKNYFSSIEEALDNLTVDFVSICTPPQTHYDLAKYALEHGCHVLLEKPLSITVEEAEKLDKIRAKTEKTLEVIHNYKFAPWFIRIKKIVDSGILGNIIHIHREMSFPYETVRMMEEGHWAHEIPGGRLMEANPHNLYLIYSLIGELDFNYIYPRKISDRWPYAIIDEFTAVLSSGKAISTIKMSIHPTSKGYGSHGPNFMVITGDKRTLIGTPHSCNFLDTISSNNISIGDLIKKYSSIAYRVASRILSFRNSKNILKDSYGNPINTGDGTGHKLLIERFIGYIEGRYSELPVTWEEAYHVQKLNYEMGMEVERIMKE